MMKVYCAFRFKPFEKEQLVGIAKTQKVALAILEYGELVVVFD